MIASLPAEQLVALAHVAARYQPRSVSARPPDAAAVKLHGRRAALRLLAGRYAAAEEALG